MKPEEHLPGKITSITPQKKNKERYSVFVEDAFLMGVDNSTLLNHQLQVGVEITPALFKQLQRDEGRNAVKNYMLKLLSQREHARHELLLKAIQKNHPSELIEDVLDELEAKDWINDRRFAVKFAEDKYALNKWGPYKIKTHLLKKGVSQKTTKMVVAQVFEAVDIKKNLEALIQKRKNHFLREEDPIKRKKKVMNYLIQKGYQPGSIYRHIERLIEMLKK